MAGDGQWAIGVDLGATKLKVAQVFDDGRVGQQVQSPTRIQGGAETIQREIERAARHLWNENGSPPSVVGIGVAGQIDARDGTVRFAPNLEWRDVPLQRYLAQALHLPALVMNDVRAATWGEWLHGAGQGCGDLVCLFVGTGIGGGAVSGGQMLIGDSNTAAELGHIVVDMNGPACTCGNRGCMEAFAGGWAIARRAREAISADPPGGAFLLAMGGNQPHAVTAEDLSRAAGAGDSFSLRLVNEVERALIAGVVGIVHAFNPGRLILGGGVIRGMPTLVERINIGVRQQALFAATEHLSIVPAQLGSDAAVVGAAALAMRLLKPNTPPGS